MIITTSTTGTDTRSSFPRITFPDYKVTEMWKKEYVSRYAIRDTPSMYSDFHKSYPYIFDQTEPKPSELWTQEECERLCQ